MPIMATGFDDKPSSNQWQRRIDISATYYVALPFLKTEDAIATGQAQEMPSASAAVRRAELMSRDPLNAGALAFRRSGNPNLGDFGEPTILGTFGEVPSSRNVPCFALARSSESQQHIVQKAATRKPRRAGLYDFIGWQGHC